MTLPSHGSSITLTNTDEPTIPAKYRLVIERATDPNPALQHQFSEGLARLARETHSKAASTQTAS